MERPKRLKETECTIEEWVAMQDWQRSETLKGLDEWRAKGKLTIDKNDQKAVERDLYG